MSLTAAEAPSSLPAHDKGSALHAVRELAADFVSTLAFLTLFALTHNVALATGLAIAVGVGQIVWIRARGRSVDAMQWLGLGLVLVFGGASLATHDARFVLIKPVLIYTAIGAVMLRPGWMTRYLPPIAQRFGGDLAFGFGYVWAALMFATAGLTLAVVLTGQVAAWAGALALGPSLAKIALFAIQYLTTRTVVVRRMRAAGFIHG